MPQVSLHGTTLAWSADMLGFDPLAELLFLLDPADEASAADVTISLQRAEQKTALDPARSGLKPSFFHGIVQAYESVDGFLLWDRGSRIHVPLNGSPLIAELVPPTREPAPGSTAAMLQIALALALRRHHLFHLHAALLVHPNGSAVLIVGGSGAGKTTSALALLEAGYGYLGDDALFLHRASDGGDAITSQAKTSLEALSFPRAFHLGKATLSAFPRLRALVDAPLRGREKCALDPRRAYPDRAQNHLHFKPESTLVLLPSIGHDAQTQLHPVPKSEAFGALLASSAAVVIEGLPHRDENLALLRALLEGARCHAIVLGRDLLADPVRALSTRVDALLETR